MLSKDLLSPGSRRYVLLVRWSIVAALWILLVSMATGKAGVSNYLELARNRDTLQDVTRELAVKNQFLEAEIKKLETSKDAQVRYLKESFGYISPGEVVFHFKDTPLHENPLRRKQREQAASAAAVRTHY